MLLELFWNNVYITNYDTLLEDTSNGKTPEQTLAGEKLAIIRRSLPM